MAVAELIEQTIAQHIANPRVISYVGTKKDEVQGRFVASNRVYNFVLDKKGVSYSPAGRQDSLVFSALFLERLDAVRKPKIGNDKCNAGKSYQCGKTCISNSWNCRKGVKDVNDARRIASILASTNERLKASIKVSDKAQARGRALFEARNKRLSNPKTVRTKLVEPIQAKESVDKNISKPTKKKDIKIIRDVVLMRANLGKEQGINDGVLDKNVSDYLEATGLLKREGKKLFLTLAKENDKYERLFADFPELEALHKEEMKQSAIKSAEIEAKKNQSERQRNKLKEKREKDREKYGEFNKTLVDDANSMAAKHDIYIPTQTKIFYVKDHPLIADYDGAEIKQIINGKKTSLTSDQLNFLKGQINNIQSKK